MARITVDDCLKNVKNRFELVHIAAMRARQLDIGGHKTRLEESGDRSTLIALREIAEGHIDSNILYNTTTDFSGMLDDGQDIGEAIRQVAQKELQDRKEREKQDELERQEAEERKDNLQDGIPRKRGRPAKKLDGPDMDESAAELSASEENSDSDADMSEGDLDTTTAAVDKATASEDSKDEE